LLVERVACFKGLRRDGSIGGTKRIVARDLQGRGGGLPEEAGGTQN